MKITPAMKKLLVLMAGGGALGAWAVGGPAGIVGGALLGGAAKLVLGRAPGRLGAAFGDDGSGGLLSGSPGAPVGAVATIEEARFAQHQLSQRLFGADDVPWWLIGVGIGGSVGAYYVLVSVNGTPPELRKIVPTSYQGVPVVADATGRQPLEMLTS